MTANTSSHTADIIPRDGLRALDVRSPSGFASGTIRWNALANYAGKSWAALLNLAFIPCYVHWMGVEAYGLVGFYVTLQGALFLFDFGLSTTLNRELACYSVAKDQAGAMRDTVRTLEALYWAVACAIGLGVGLLSAPIAQYWVHAEGLPVESVERAVLLMGVTAALQWPVALYTGGLLGLQRQVLSNALNAALLTVRFGGAALVLVRIDSSIKTFFTWQIVASFLQVLTLAWVLWRVLPEADDRPTFRLAVLARLWRFTAGLSGATIATLVFVQVDKIVLSNWLTLQEFAYYSLAWTVAGVLYLFYNPVTAAVFPVFSQKVALGDEEGIARLYHQGCQWIGATVLPQAAVCVFFAPEILQVWMRNPDVVQQTHALVSVIICGAALGALTCLPVMVQWAYGWTRLSFQVHVLGVAMLIPCLWVGNAFWGPVGAAGAWVAMRALVSWLLMERMHRRLLTREKRRWLRQSVLQPLGSSLLVAAGLRWLIGEPKSMMAAVGTLAVVCGVTTTVALLATPLPARALLSFPGRLLSLQRSVRDDGVSG